eukprot:TRINITY_DN25885_c0_g1_i1.p1 TRINITY_DN25885_c0_g1~~TRINITY_DN25885_c0_g1_i1.p1  ORF type:complete len:251 (-),score=27.07 TRINITY_DN25885_c0_g1_i1:441-1193(-)
MAACGCLPLRRLRFAVILQLLAAVTAMRSTNVDEASAALDEFEMLQTKGTMNRSTQQSSTPRHAAGISIVSMANSSLLAVEVGAAAPNNSRGSSEQDDDTTAKAHRDTPNTLGVKEDSNLTVHSTLFVEDDSDLIMRLKSSQSGDPCPTDDKFGRIGCSQGCSCRWFEACYPLTRQSAVGPADRQQLGQCSLRVLGLVVASVMVFLSLVILVVLLRMHLQLKENEFAAYDPREASFGVSYPPRDCKADAS